MADNLLDLLHILHDLQTDKNARMVLKDATEEIEWLRLLCKQALILDGRAADEIERLEGDLARAADMIRIKDELIGKQSSRIVYLEGRA